MATLADTAAELAITGGFDTKPSNLCPRCFQYRPTSGWCGCEQPSALDLRHLLGH